MDAYISDSENVKGARSGPNSECRRWRFADTLLSSFALRFVPFVIQDRRW